MYQDQVTRETQNHHFRPFLDPCVLRFERDTRLERVGHFACELRTRPPAVLSGSARWKTFWSTVWGWVCLHAGRGAPREGFKTTGLELTQGAAESHATDLNTL